MRQRLDVDERWCPDVHPVRLGGAVRCDVATDLAARALDGDVDLAFGDLEAFGEDLEVVDQRFHRLVDASARWRRDLLVLDAVVTPRQLVEDLADDADRLVDLVQPDGVTIERVAVAADDDVELDVGVAQVRHAPTQVPGDTGGTQDRTGRAERQRLLRGDDPDALQPLAPDRLAGHQDVVLLEPGREDVHQRPHVVAPVGGQIGGDTADTDVVVVHPKAGDLLEEAQHLLALAPAVDDHRHGTKVEAVGRQVQQVAADPVQLRHQHPDPHGALWDRVVDAEQLLDGHGEDELVVERAGVVHASDVRAALQVRQLFALLLHPGVQVADDRLAAQDLLAFQLQHQPQHAVRRRVLRPHVDDHRLIFGGVDCLLAERGRFGLGHAQHRADFA